MEGIRQICAKELARVFKDGKMLISVFIFPVAIMIVVMSLVSNLSNRAEKDVEAHKSIVYVENVPEGFESFLLTADQECSIYTKETIADVLETEWKGTPDDTQVKEAVKAAIKEGGIDLMIAFPKEFLDL